jgi:NCAIR mutase (PurE)-related protein
MSDTEFLLDFQRSERIGIGEAIYAEGKTTIQLTGILDHAAARDAPTLLTRLAANQFEALPRRQRDRMDYDPVSRTGFFGTAAPLRGPTQVGVLCAGTSDIPAASEAIRTLRFNGHAALAVHDVGVAGLWRVMARLDEIRPLPVLIVAAGMDGALPTVLGGLVPGCIVALPTSVGYGVADGGRTALNAILSSCAPGIVAVNIDNGYGAACAALRMLRLLGKPGA